VPPSLSSRAAFRGLFGALVGSQIAYSRIPDAHPRRGVGRLVDLLVPKNDQPPLRVAATRGIVGLMLAASSADAVASRGGARAARLVGSAGGLGFATELAGVATGRPFGHYTYGRGLGAQVGGVPLLAAAAWAMMARPAWVVGGLLTRSRVRRVALSAGALTAWDVFLDPRMVREGYWTWPGGGRYEDVPASNFLGWFATAAGVFAVWSVLDPHDDPVLDGDGALSLYAWTWIGETFANAAIWRRPRVALAGGAAMGAFAAPALLARRRRLRDVPVPVADAP
jgi:putative membrane protein